MLASCAASPGSEVGMARVLSGFSSFCVGSACAAGPLDDCALGCIRCSRPTPPDGCDGARHGADVTGDANAFPRRLT